MNKWNIATFLGMLSLFILTYCFAASGSSAKWLATYMRKPIADASIICIGMSTGLLAYERHRRR